LSIDGGTKVVNDVMENLRKAVMEYDVDAAATWARKAVTEKVDLFRAIDALTETIREIGDRFGKGELWLPDLVGAADAMQAAMPILEEELGKTGEKREALGSVVVGTVFGDIHNIGKAMVCTLLTAGGFNVYDLGVNVKSEEFVAAVKKHDADILAMSALLTTTAPEQRKVIETLKSEGIRDKVKIMVGGGAITQEFAEGIGADGYDPTAPGAIELAKRLILTR
jgi:corrinoid protein of di/trimethylamine methyltransferase